MTDKLRDMLGGSSPSWIVGALLLFVLVGPAGVERILDGYFPARDVVEIKKSQKIVNSTAQNVRLLIRNSEKIDTILLQIDLLLEVYDDLMNSHSRLESKVDTNSAWIAFRNRSMRPDRFEQGMNE